MAKVLVGMSGGVDSAAAAYVLKEQGHEVIGVTLRTWVSDDGTESRCCEIDDARRVAMRIGIPYYPLNSLKAFQEEVTEPFIKDYMEGRTPNPCILCNRYVKWERMMYFMHVLQADYIATGHYAGVIRKPNGRYTVQTALHGEKDQTYMLYRLTQEQLAHTMMPLASYSKEEVRALAQQFDFAVAGKPDSQELCFVPEGTYGDFIRKQAPGEIPGEGDFVDETGRVLGRHRGILHYTVGQRRGLGIAAGERLFVTEIWAAATQVVLGPEGSLYRDEIRCRDLHFLSIPRPEPGTVFRCRVKIRYRHPAVSAFVQMEQDGALIRFETPVRAPAPGQSAVFYDEDRCVIGGGVIAGIDKNLDPSLTGP